MYIFAISHFNKLFTLSTLIKWSTYYQHILQIKYKYFQKLNTLLWSHRRSFGALKGRFGILRSLSYG